MNPQPALGIHAVNLLKVPRPHNERTLPPPRSREVFYPIKIEDVAVGFHNIQEELRSQYSLIYRPAGFQAGRPFQDNYLQALDPRFQVRASKGYFAPRATP